MRKIFSFLMATTDGYYEGPNQEFDFWTIDDEFNEFSRAQLAEADTLLFGRVTYEGMAAYWPTPAAHTENPEIAARMNEMAKIVVSRTLGRAEWANTRVVRRPEELATGKGEPGADIAVLGSSDLTVSLLRLGLIDELRIMVSLVILGAGRSIFRTATERTPLELLEAIAFDSGNLLLRYAPAPHQERP